MNIDEIRRKISKDILSHGYHLYSLKYYKDEKRLEVLVDESVNINEITILSQIISKLMDQYDKELESYILDVASAGCERNIDDIKTAINKNIYLRTKKEEIIGLLKSYDDNILELESYYKNVKKTIKCKKEEILEIRYSVIDKEKTK